MKTLHTVFATLRKKGNGQYKLLAGCLLFASLLITSYSMLLYSPTVQNVLPVGGDSRKQVTMIFALAVIGCTAFSVYAAGLFFRYKSREAGIFLALGMSKRVLSHQLLWEVLGLTLAACGTGLVLGTPLCWLIWSILRQTVVDTQEMHFTLNLGAYLVPVLFALFVLAALAAMEHRFLRRVNVLDIIQESHRAEPVRAVPRWYGWGGIVMIVVGMLLGYFVPTFCVTVLHWYAPAIFTAPFYLPVLVGLYWVLLYTVVGGWHRGKNRYLHLIESGMMQFQGRQTVRNMLVITVLVAGAYFASFYTPLALAPGKTEIQQRPRDYSFFYRADQDMIDEEEIRKIAAAHQVQLTDYVEVDSSSLAVDGYAHMEEDGPMGTTYKEVYQETLCEMRFVPVSGWNTLIGDDLTLAPGQSAATLSHYSEVIEIGLVTNPLTGKQLKVETVGEPLNSNLLRDILVLNDQDYNTITQGLTADWQERQVVFDAQNDSYAFSKELFHAIVEHSGKETALISGYDRIVRQNQLEEGQEYALDPENLEAVGFSQIQMNQPDSADFRMNWMYMPRFRELDQGDFVANFAVFLMLFVFVAVLCFAAVLVILYTRSQTLMLSNLWVYEDLRKLGASSAYIRKTAQGQVKRVFQAPILIGTVAILGFFTLILAGNGGDGHINASEWIGLVACLLVVLAMSAVFYGLYRMCVKKAWQMVNAKQ